MSDCCCPNTPAKNKQLCPECRVICKGVGMPTLYHQVRFPENQTLITDSYFFCPSKTCAVGYFSSAGNLIDKQQLRCYQTIQNDALCYCFDIGTKQYLAALKAHCAEPIKDFVMQRTKWGNVLVKSEIPLGNVVWLILNISNEEWQKVINLLLETMRDQAFNQVQDIMNAYKKKSCE